MMPQLRTATIDDVPLVLEFIRALAAYEKMSDEVEATEAGLRETLFPAEGPPAAYCLLAFATGKDGQPIPAGFALYFFNYSTFLARRGLYLEDLYVHPEFRGRGFGKALLLHLAQLANRLGCGRMEWSVLDWNEPAIRFYEGLGASRLRTWQICRLSGKALSRHA